MRKYSDVEIEIIMIGTDIITASESYTPDPDELPMQPWD